MCVMTTFKIYCVLLYFGRCSPEICKSPPMWKSTKFFAYVLRGMLVYVCVCVCVCVCVYVWKPEPEQQEQEEERAMRDYIFLLALTLAFLALHVELS